MDARETIVGVLPLTLGASCAALWAWQHPERHQERRKGGTPELQEESAVQENGELREKLEELAREHAEALRQVEVLREQLGAAGNEQDRERRQGERLAAQLELQQTAHLETSKELSAEAGRLRDYSNELIFVMIMHGLAPDAVSEPSSSGRSGPDDQAREEVDADAALEPAALLAQNKRLAGEVARLRAQIARAVALSRQVDRGWGDGAAREQPPSPARLLAQERKRVALAAVEPLALSPAVSPATTPLKGLDEEAPTRIDQRV